MEFSTDKFMTAIRKQLNGIADDFINDMCDDACIVSRRLIDETNNDKCLNHMNEISSLAEMCTNMKYDCDALVNAFEDVFRREHGSGDICRAPAGALQISPLSESRSV